MTPHELLAWTTKRAQLRLLCPYDVASLDQPALEVGHRTHPVVRHWGRQLSSDLYVGIDGVTAHFEGPLPAPKGQVDEFVFAPGQYLEVRDFFARRAVQAQLPTMRRADLEWAVTELVTNSIHRGGGRGKVRVWADSAGLVFEVQDRGRIENPLVGREHLMLPEEHGRGLWLVNQLCHLAQIRSSDAGTTVRIHVSRAQGNREWVICLCSPTSCLPRWTASVRMSTAGSASLIVLCSGSSRPGPRPYCCRFRTKAPPRGGSITRPRRPRGQRGR
jgi:anti-sigma regulatory factor (Ser/Thr protein kinase)